MILCVVFLAQVAYLLQQGHAVGVNSSVSVSPSISVVSNVSSVVSNVSSVATNVSPSVSPTNSQQDTSSTTNNDLLNLLNKVNNLNKGYSSVDLSQKSSACEQLDWSPDMNCVDRKCAEAYIQHINSLLNCITKKTENVSLLELGGLMQKACMLISKNIMAQVKSGTPNNITHISALDNFVVFSGVLDDKYINNTKEIYARFPNYSDPTSLTSKWETMRDEIAIPIEEFLKRASPYWPFVVSIHSNLVENRPLKMTEIETDYNEIIRESELSDLYLEGNDLKSRKKPQDMYINTNVLVLNFDRSFSDLEKPVLVTMRHKKVGNLEKPVCVFWDTVNSIWSKKGCSVQETNSTHTICAYDRLAAFAVAMKEKTVEDLSARETLVIVAIALGTISLILLVGCAVCIFVVGYHCVDNMRIALNLDLALVLCQLFFFIGLSNSASKYLATPATCKVISPFVHMFELAALSFLLMEGLHYYDKFKPFFSKKNTRTFYIYFSLGWGIPAAFGAAVAGYNYNHHGSPITNEFCWMSVYGKDAMYFGAPVIILALMNLVVRAFVLKNVMAWKGDPDNLNIERTKMRSMTSMVLLLVIILAWLLGILATNQSEQKEFHYLFVVFHALQGVFVFTFYCAKNSEMWTYHKDQKEMKEAEKNAVYTFQYVP